MVPVPSGRVFQPAKVAPVFTRVPAVAKVVFAAVPFAVVEVGAVPPVLPFPL